MSVASDHLADKPELPADLKSMTVMAASVLHLDALVGEIQAERQALRRLTSALTEVLKAFSDLYQELTDESGQRKFLDRSIRKAEREAQRLRLPLWFWRPEHGLELRRQIFRRARFLLFDQKACLDDIFDLLRPIPDLCPACECKAYWDVVWRDVVKFMWRGSVERINALAEKHATVNKDNMPLWMTFMHYGKKFSYIHAADIVMEELDK